MPGSDLESTSPAVAFESVAFEIGGRRILRGIDLRVARRETVALVGRSGAGKTTTLKLVNRLLEPSSGTVRVAGRPTGRWDPVELRRRTGWVIQEIGLFPHMSVARNVGIVPELLGWEADRVRSRVEELLEMVGLPPATFADRPPAKLSGGQRQRVGVARALAADPPLLLLDEPFGALDPLTRAGLRREFRGLMERLGKAALFVTHDLREALAVGDRVGLLAGGELVELCEPAAFLGSDRPEARELVATLEDPVEDRDG